ncbi:PREDICTED: inositol 1,3,4-trisphosphate 5/6-kinase 4 isoform X1 [Theobroma cacao]|uniref:inositol-1,3,4-trisphosphate 5/6-kinase n=1 Tax=Theobroma cacao TaxID=3641 RepID=A0AB32WDA4_THECC|nr:PREDICTED: inositol 1,3,4-trisphosphate 5/6-kinase 4 isoform X1 [Theobroma cacao]
MGGVVRGVIVDHALLQHGNGEPDNNNPTLSLLRKLPFSNIRTAISYGLPLSADQVNLLQAMADLHSLQCLPLTASSMDIAPREIAQAWAHNSGTILYLLPNRDASPKITCTFFSIAPGADVTSAHNKSNRIYMDKLEELPLTICRLNKKAISNDVVTVGYIMKPSREEDFAKRGAFPMCATPNGLIFLPLTFKIPISTQLEEVDVILHKATDEIVSIELNSFSEPSYRIAFTTGMQELQRNIENHNHCFEVDPLSSIYPVLDRLTIQQILLGLEDLNSGGRCKVRAPHFFKVDRFDEPDLVQRLRDAKLSVPSIVKPQVACGVADAHSMAIVFRVEDFKDLSVPLPAVVQEYVDHSSTLFKVYVLGERVFHAVKKSTPNADILMKSSEINGLRPLLFDSLKSLPTGTGNQHSGGQDLCLDLALVKEAAEWLSRRLGLTIFGFDVVIQEGSGDHVIVDVNYLPSFKEVPDGTAIPAFWDAIKKKVDSKAMKQASVAASHGM